MHTNVQVFFLSNQQRRSRGHNLRGQGQGIWKSPRPRPGTELPRTGCLEAKNRKARGQGLEDTFENTRKCKYVIMIS